MAKIFVGDITMWDDPLIVYDNDNTTSLPHQPINLVIRETSGGTNNIFSHAMNEAYPRFGETVGVGMTMNFSNATYSPTQTITYTSSFTDNVVSVLLNQYSICYATPEAANQVSAKLGNMINNYGSSVSVTSDTIQTAAVEIGLVKDIGYYDFSGASSEYAYPVAGAILALYNVASVRTTCSAKQSAYDFLTWFQTSASVAALSTTLNILPGIVLRESNYVVPTPTCSGIPLTTINVGNTGVLSGAYASEFVSNALKFYQTVDNTRQYTYTRSTELNAVAQLLNGEIDVAVVAPDYTNETSTQIWNEYISSGSLTLLPALIIASIPLFNLPVEIGNLTSTAFQYELYGATIGGDNGIALDIPTLSAIWTGNINDWMHPNVSQYTPWLAERQNHLLSINPAATLPMQLVICCEDPTADTTSMNILATGMYQALSPGGRFGDINYVPNNFDYTTAIANSYNRWQLPFDWSTNRTQLDNHINTTMVQNEAQIAPTVSLLSNSIGYGFTTQSTHPTTTAFIIYNPPRGTSGGAGGTSVTSSNTNRLNCLIPQSNPNINYFSLQLNSASQRDDCWIFEQLVSFTVLSYYEDNQGFPITVSTANETLNMLQWLLTNPGLQPAALSTGVSLIQMNSTNGLPYNNPEVIHALQYVQCNGANCLITLPTYWSISASVVGFGYAVSSIMIVLCLVSAIIVWIFRSRTVIKSASVIFLEIMLVGIILLFLGVIALIQPPTDNSCSAFMWLADMGLMLTFTPLFLKMYRIYKIFSKKQLKVVRLSDSKLLSYASLKVIFNIVFMSVWQAVSPLQPLTTHVYNGVHQQQYLQCNLTGSGTVYVVALGVEKAVFILFGCVMSFGTRKVTGTFNESTSVAWSIYNTILAAGVLIPIIAFVQALGDTLIILIIIMICWITISVYGFLVANKLYALTVGEIQGQLSQLDSARTITGGFSFVSVDALTKVTIGAYIKALKTHLGAVEQRNKILNESPDAISTDKPFSNISRKGSATSQAFNEHQVLNSSLNKYAHHQIAPVRRDPPSFVNRGESNATPDLYKSRRTNSVVHTPIFSNTSAFSSPPNVVAATLSKDSTDGHEHSLVG